MNILKHVQPNSKYNNRISCFKKKKSPHVPSHCENVKASFHAGLFDFVINNQQYKIDISVNCRISDYFW